MYLDRVHVILLRAIVLVMLAMLVQTAVKVSFSVIGGVAVEKSTCCAKDTFYLDIFGPTWPCFDFGGYTLSSLACSSHIYKLGLRPRVP